MTIEAGDIMIKHRVEGDSLGRLIKAGQLLTSGPSNMIHAGIAYSSTKLIEMDGEGLKRNLLAENARHGYRYDVFRCKEKRLARAASAVAELMWRGVTGETGGKGPPAERPPPTMKIRYDARAAACSVLPTFYSTFGLVTGEQDNNCLAMQWIQGLSGEAGSAFFCSQHVVLCYQIAGRQMRAQYKHVRRSDEKAERITKAYYKRQNPDAPDPERVFDMKKGRVVVTSEVIQTANDPAAGEMLIDDPYDGVPVARVLGGVKVTEVFQETAEKYNPGFLWQELWKDQEVWVRVGEYRGGEKIGDIKEK